MYLQLIVFPIFMGFSGTESSVQQTLIIIDYRKHVGMLTKHSLLKFTILSPRIATSVIIPQLAIIHILHSFFKLSYTTGYTVNRDLKRI